MLRNADDAALAQQHLDAPERAGILRHGMVDRVEHPDHRRGARAGFREVETAGHRVRVVAQITRTAGGRAVDRPADPDPYPHLRGSQTRLVGAPRLESRTV